MTEEQWLASDDPAAMLARLNGIFGFEDRIPSTNRKLRLAACGCCRTVWALLGPKCRRAVVALEAQADGLPVALELLARDEDEQRQYLVRPRHFLSRADRARWSAADAVVTLADAVGPGWPRHPGFLATTARARMHAAGLDPDVDPASDSQRPEADVLRDVFGNPWRPMSEASLWKNFTTVECQTLCIHVAMAVYEERQPDGALDPARLAVLSDVLEESGCDAAGLLTHLRAPGPHVRGCWALDLILGKE